MVVTKHSVYTPNVTQSGAAENSPFRLFTIACVYHDDLKYLTQGQFTLSSRLSLETGCLVYCGSLLTVWHVACAPLPFVDQMKEVKRGVCCGRNRQFLIPTSISRVA